MAAPFRSRSETEGRRPDHRTWKTEGDNDQSRQPTLRGKISQQPQTYPIDNIGVI